MKRQSSSNLFGIIVILIGAYLLAYNLNLPIISSIGLGDIIGICWPLLLVAWGLDALSKRNLIFGTIVTVLGLFFLTDNLSQFFPVLDRVSEFAWPLAIIGVGVYVMLAPPKKKGISESDFSTSYKSSSKSSSSPKYSFTIGENSTSSNTTTKTAPVAPKSKVHYTIKTYPAPSAPSAPSAPAAPSVPSSPLAPSVTPVIRTASTVSAATAALTPTSTIDENTIDENTIVELPPEEASNDLIQSDEEFLSGEQTATAVPIVEHVEVDNPNVTRSVSSNKVRSYNTSFNSRKLIFTEQDFVEGDNQLELSILFGDVSIILPPTVTVSFAATITLGDVHFFGRRYDGISQTVKDLYEPAISNGKHLVVNASVMLGDLRIKSS